MTDIDKGVKAPEELFDAKRKSFSPEFKREASASAGECAQPGCGSGSRNRGSSQFSRDQGERPSGKGGGEAAPRERAVPVNGCAASASVTAAAGLHGCSHLLRRRQMMTALVFGFFLSLGLTGHVVARKPAGAFGEKSNTRRKL